MIQRVGRAPPASKAVQRDPAYSTSSMVCSPALGLDFYVLASGVVRVKAVTRNTQDAAHIHAYKNAVVHVYAAYTHTSTKSF